MRSVAWAREAELFRRESLAWTRLAFIIGANAKASEIAAALSAGERKILIAAR